MLNITHPNVKIMDDLSQSQPPMMVGMTRRLEYPELFQVEIPKISSIYVIYYFTELGAHLQSKIHVLFTSYLKINRLVY